VSAPHGLFHNRWHLAHPAHTESEKLGGALPSLPPLEDANAVQFAVMQVANLILNNQIDGKTANRLLYALQIASTNLKQAKFETSFSERIVVDLESVKNTPLHADAWSRDDFESNQATSKPPTAEKLISELNGLIGRR
jgi:hypothetical protein